MDTCRCGFVRSKGRGISDRRMGLEPPVRPPTQQDARPGKEPDGGRAGGEGNLGECLVNPRPIFSGGIGVRLLIRK